MKNLTKYESYVATGVYDNIEELDRDCMMVVLKSSTSGGGGTTPERFWSYEVIFKKDWENEAMKKYFAISRYKPSTIPHYSNEVVINAMNQNIERGQYKYANTEVSKP